LNIFEVLAAPGFLLQNEVNNALLQSLLDACNSILANHLNGAFHLSVDERGRTLRRIPKVAGQRSIR
jgi:hypothetical protein